MCDKETITRIRVVWVTLLLGFALNLIIVTAWGTSMRKDVDVLLESNSRGERFTWENGLDIRHDIETMANNQYSTALALEKVAEKMNSLELFVRTRHPDATYP